MLEAIKNVLWSPLTVALITALGCVIMIKTKCRTVIALPRILKDSVCSIKKDRRAFSLMCTSLGGTIGVGNAVGVAGAISEGGAGAVFWMAVAGAVGAGIKYAEVYFAMKYHGPVNYIEKETSRLVSTIYAFTCIAVSFGMGNTAQVRAALSSASGTLPIHSAIIALVMAVLFYHVSRGGIEKIRSFSVYAVPTVSVVYVTSLIVIIIVRINTVDDVLTEVFKGSGILTGVRWYLIKQGIVCGFTKSVFSSEAGLGSAGFAHSESDSSPEAQAKWGLLEVYADTLICVITALALLTFGNATDTRSAFSMGLGKTGEAIYCASILVFAFSSLICWYYNGERAVLYVTKKKRLVSLYRSVFGILIFLSAFATDNAVTDLSDIANALMLLINVFVLLKLVFKNSLTF